MTTIKNQALLLGTLMIFSLLIFSGNVAFAASSKTTAAEVTDVCDDGEEMDDENENQADRDDENDAEEKCEKERSAELGKQAKVSEGRARQIAESNYSGAGKITEVELDTDEGDTGISRIVYEIEFTDASGAQVDVKVDALSGAYLGVDTEDEEDGETDDDTTVHQNGNGKSADVRGLQVQLITLLQQLIMLLKA